MQKSLEAGLILFVCVMKTTFMLTFASLVLNLSLTKQAQSQVYADLFIHSIQPDSIDSAVYQIKMHDEGAPNEIIHSRLLPAG